MKNKMYRTSLSTPLSGAEKETKLRIRNLFSGPQRLPLVLFLVLMFPVCILCGNLMSRRMPVAEPPGHSTPDASPSAEEWVNYLPNLEEFPWDDSAELELPKYPGVTFRWMPGNLCAITTQIDAVNIHQLLTGMPVCSVFLCDLNGDGKRELCATVFWGSGLMDTHIEVYDYAASQRYVLWDRGEYDYTLSLEDGRLRVSRWENPGQGKPLSTGGLALSSDNTQEGEWFIAQPATPSLPGEPLLPETNAMSFGQPLELPSSIGAGDWCTDFLSHPGGSLEGEDSFRAGRQKAI